MGSVYSRMASYALLFLLSRFLFTIFYYFNISGPRSFVYVIANVCCYLLIVNAIWPEEAEKKHLVIFNSVLRSFKFRS
jgi:uncharacterized MAPEG superfamily protein